MTEKLWEPSEQQLKTANMTRYMNHLKEKHNLTFNSYDELYDWSINNRAAFWASLWDFGNVIYSRPYDTVLENPDDMLNSIWFPGARMNYAENLLRFRDDHPALVFKSENLDRDAVTMTYRELYEEVARLAKALRREGVGIGDRVVGFMPNMIETIVAFLAASSIGAIWSSCSPDFGFRGVLDRFGQIKPKILFVADGYFYNGKTFDLRPRVSEILKALPSIEKVVVVPYVDPEPDIGRIPNSILYEDFLTGESKERGEEIEFEQLPFDHPLYILYSSGTTGVPKCMVHGAGGSLLQHIKELMLHSNLKREDKIFYFTTCGWMMWNWLISSLTVEATVLLFDGSPFYPDSGALWDFAEKQGMTIFGTSAKYLAAVEKDGLRPGEKYDLNKLKAILSTGSPLSIESFEFVYRDIKQDLVLSSISGGSDIVSCFALGNPIGPVWAGELQCRGLGIKVDVFDEKGNSIKGKKGELVCKASFPSQPIYFWDDEDKKKYRHAYFEVYPNVWHHGDYAELTEHNGMIIYGRSDATLNPGGVRIGTAEIYRPVEAMEEIMDSVVVGQNWDDDVRVILFVKLVGGVELDEELMKKIKRIIRTNCTPRHVPAKIIAIDDIPYTISGKKVELAVQKVIQNEEVLNRDALKNPEALELYRDLEELRS
ncbi:MAG: acetoacetate--CoA ligase [Thermoplasmata archaeon]|nr:acetoacetate--CoA ligase [Thermoplasmata archaeon]